MLDDKKTAREEKESQTPFQSVLFFVDCVKFKLAHAEVLVQGHSRPSRRDALDGNGFFVEVVVVRERVGPLIHTLIEHGATDIAISDVTKFLPGKRGNRESK